MALTIFLTHSQEKKITITFSDDENPFETATVADLKDRAHRIFGWPVEHIRLICGDRLLEDEGLLSEYGIQHGSIVHMIVKLSGGGSETHGMGERGGRNASKEQISDFDAIDTEESRSCCII